MNASQEFHQLFAAVRQLRTRATPEPAALATIVRTQGSTFRRAGASMLVHANGEVTCALSGGCPQRDIVLRAQRAIEQRAPALVPYNRQSNFDVMLEMGCGGELDVLIEPLLCPPDFHFLDELARLHDARGEGVVATVFARGGAVSMPRPWRSIQHAAGHWTDIPAPGLAERVLAMAVAAPSRGQAVVERVEADGAAFEVLLTTWRPKPALVVVGHNDGAFALARLGHGLGWQVTLVDHADAALPPSLDDATASIVATPAVLPAALPFDRRTAVVVMTHNVERDLAYAQALAPLSVAYLGVIGSRERARRIRQAVGETAAPLHAPAGLDIGSETPQEIALSIAAEILAALNTKSGDRLSWTQGPIHA
jgi:xanthine/CO dehydrogenase XdhC/CoxF family maturation factor